MESMVWRKQWRARFAEKTNEISKFGKKENGKQG
jgi:hypothetical protein